MERVKIDMEFIMRASPSLLYTFFTTPECLIRWFCDEADIQDDIFTFTWQGEDEVAQLVDDLEEERVRFVWEEGEEGEYFEFRTYKSAVTNETVLEISDFCDKGEEDDQRNYWETLMVVLKKETGG